MSSCGTSGVNVPNLLRGVIDTLHISSLYVWGRRFVSHMSVLVWSLLAPPQLANHLNTWITVLGHSLWDADKSSLFPLLMNDARVSGCGVRASVVQLFPDLLRSFPLWFHPCQVTYFQEHQCPNSSFSSPRTTLCLLRTRLFGYQFALSVEGKHPIM